jgi:hypothetical protein
MLKKRLSELKALGRGLARGTSTSSLLRTQLVSEAMDALRKEQRFDDPKCLIPFGYKVYSQNDEDGIINEIFNRIGVVSQTFVEFGVGNGLENNTYALLFKGWNGLWIDGDPELVAGIRANLPNTIAAGTLSVINSFVTVANINDLISSVVRSKEIDLLSIDIDGNDFYVLDAITCVEPRAIVTEYNAKFPPPWRFCMDYDASHVWSGDDCFGASLSFFEEGLSRKGYRLVGCNLTGSNAFFVREDLVEDKFLGPHTAETHYQPARYYLSEIASGHNSSFKALERSATARSSSRNK